jgi:hypothetical protein
VNEWDGEPLIARGSILATSVIVLIFQIQIQIQASDHCWKLA